MIFSFNKLKEIANLPKEIKVEDVVNAINQIGFEVEEYNKFSEVEGIKFGFVEKVEKNPQGDKLNVCTIQFEDKKRIIQTTDDSIKENKYIVAFVPGSKLGKITFAAKKMKGIVSEGMVGALEEFGINKDLLPDYMHDSVLLLDKVDLKDDPITYFGLDDYIIDVDILSNRSDANSYYIMAQELSAYFDTKVKLPIKKVGSYKANIKAKNGLANIFSMMEIKKENYETSIEDMMLLIKNNIKPLSPLVDLSNLTLLMTGVPTHAYDKKLIGKTVEVVKHTGKVNVFGNKVVELKDGLVIKDEKQVISVAGVIGLENTGISASTETAIFEMAKFDVKDVRITTRQVKLNTDASKQSSKQISLGQIYLAHAYLSNKVKTFSESINLPLIKIESIKYDKNYIDQVAGVIISNTDQYEKAIKSLKKLGFIFEGKKVIFPTTRHDLKSMQDMSEEIFRFYGYKNFEAIQPKLSPSKVNVAKELNVKVAATGYQQAWTYTLISELKNKVNIFDFKNTVKLKTFVSKEREVLRNSIANSLLEIIEYNQKRKLSNLSVFDIGQINQDTKVLGLASNVKSFKEMQIDIANIFQKEFTYIRASHKELHNGLSAYIMDKNEKIGWIGKLHPSIDKTQAFVAEIILKSENAKVKMQNYDSNQLQTRDINLTLKLKEEIGLKIQSIKKINGIEDINIIDSFNKEGEKIITLRISGSKEAIKQIDKKYN